MEWDKFKMAQRFLQRANAIHPEEAETNSDRDSALALQDLYYECYMNSFSHATVMTKLEEAAAGTVMIPADAVDLDERKYREVYVREAGKLLESLARGEFT